MPKLFADARKNRKLINWAVSIAAVLILFFIDVAKPADSAGRIHQICPSYMTIQDQEQTVICNAAGDTCIADGNLDTLYSADQRKMAFIDMDRNLYYMEDMTPVLIKAQVSCAEFSFFGDSVLYLADSDEGSQELGIYLTAEQRTEHIMVENCSFFAGDSDGRTVAYVENDPEGMGTMRLWKPGGIKTDEVQNVSLILSVAEDGREILYVKNENQIYRYRGGEEQQLDSFSEEGVLNFILNEDQTEILYTVDGKAFYYTAEAERPVCLSGVEGAFAYSCHMPATAYQQGQRIILGRETLRGMLFAIYEESSDSCRIYRLEENRDGKGTVMEAVPFS